MPEQHSLDELADVVRARRADKKLTLYPATHERMAWVVDLVTSQLKKSMGFSQFREVFGTSPPWTMSHSDVIDLLILLFLRELDPKLLEGFMPEDVQARENIIKQLEEKYHLLDNLCPR